MSISVKKITFIGGGSAYIPLIVDEIVKSNSFSELCEILFIAPTNEKMNIISGFCLQLFCSAGKNINIVKKNKVDKEIADSDVIISIYRSGGLKYRHLDETDGLDFDILGQESQGFGGFSSALRNIAVLKEIAPVIKKYAPNALYINITNPSGILTAAARKLGINSIGICDVPFAMRLKLAKYFEVNSEDVSFKYIGLNHLGWLTEIRVKDEFVLEKLLNSADVEGFMNMVKQSNIPSVRINLEFFKALNAIPSSYLFYYYNTREIIEEIKRNKLSRAQKVDKDNRRLYLKYKESSLKEWPNFFQNERGAYLLGKTVVSFLTDYACDVECTREHVICIPNDGTLSFLEDDKIIETQVSVKNGIIKPLCRNLNVNGHIKSLMMAVSEYERMTAYTGIFGDKKMAFEALASHPLIPTVDVASKLLNKIISRDGEYITQFK